MAVSIFGERSKRNTARTARQKIDTACKHRLTYRIQQFAYGYGYGIWKRMKIVPDLVVLGVASAR